MTAFLHMGGYADFIWPVYAGVVIVFICLCWLSKRRLRSVIKQLREQHAAG